MRKSQIFTTEENYQTTEEVVVYEGERPNFAASEKELIGTIDELAGGIVQVKKGASFLQVKKNLKPVVDVLAKIIEASGVDSAKKRALGAFLQTNENDDLSLKAPQAATEEYSSHSGGIVETLEDMKTKAEDQLTTARKGAMESKHNYDMTKMSLEQEIKNLKAQLPRPRGLRRRPARPWARRRATSPRWRRARRRTRST